MIIIAIYLLISHCCYCLLYSATSTYSHITPRPSIYLIMYQKAGGGASPTSSPINTVAYEGLSAPAILEKLQKKCEVCTYVHLFFVGSRLDYMMMMMVNEGRHACIIMILIVRLSNPSFLFPTPLPKQQQGKNLPRLSELHTLLIRTKGAGDKEAVTKAVELFLYKNIEFREETTSHFFRALCRAGMYMYVCVVGR